MFRHGVHAVIVCGLATYAYASRRSAVHRMAALRAMQLGRADMERRVLESRLAAVQARVEPQLLLDTLARVERLYAIDGDGADRLLRELTTYLRAAIPQADDPASTVSREIRLANAYLNIVGPQSGDRLRMAGSTRLLAESIRMPPMVLLPLVNHALAHRTSTLRDDAFFEVDLAVACGVVLTIRDRDTGFSAMHANASGVVDIRARLAALYGATSQLTLTETAVGSEAVLAFPQLPDAAHAR
jgi:LytS/YehU family sensor histidine kinase